MGVARMFQGGGGGVTLSYTEVLTRLSPEYCRLFAYNKACKEGVTGTLGSPWLRLSLKKITFRFQLAQEKVFI